MRSVPPLGAPGVATGDIAIGTVATSKSITITTTIRTIISTATSTARDKGIGSIIRNIAETRRTVIEELRTNSAATRVSNRAVAEELEVVVAPAVRAGLVELAAQVAREARAELVSQVALAEPAAQVAVAQALVPAVEVPELVPVEAEPEHARAAVEQERVLAEAAPEHGPVAVPPRTKSVIAAHHRGLPPLLAAVVDLVAVAQTMREQAAAEAVKAWEAAD